MVRGFMKEKEHLPLLGVGPIINGVQVVITIIGIILSYQGYFVFWEFELLNIPLKIIGIGLVVFGIYLNYSAKRKSRLFDMVTENKLITTGVYGIVRNPVYSAVLLVCTGAIFIVNNVVLFIVPIICWIYITVFLILTEEKWLVERYGQEYEEYCKKVNRCIPWFQRCK